MVEPVNGHDVHWSPFRQWGAYIAIKTLQIYEMRELFRAFWLALNYLPTG